MEELYKKKKVIQITQMCLAFIYISSIALFFVSVSLFLVYKAPILYDKSEYITLAIVTMILALVAVVFVSFLNYILDKSVELSAKEKLIDIEIQKRVRDKHKNEKS